ncbi:MAG: helix-turn-helix domain-containing protein [Deltaproteobacteria bacterium]|nr:helix-turn-helix domain-containing protein [Deltaproteobacteria bacterium]MBK7066866.1 helix-turn-helix domain-containing protein [Deltaproteobacteria bacterium]MBP6829214.1 helix-turn-helix domain-containing protein [Deltaproteobacteria bacterium]
MLTIPEAAALCRVSVDVMYRLAAKGQVPAAKVGSQWRLLRSALLRWLDEGGSATPPSPPPRGQARSPAPKGETTRARTLRALRGG